MRPSVALIYVAIAVISVCITAVLHRLTGLPLELAGMFGAVLFFGLAALDQAVSRANERKTFQQQLELSDHALQDAFNEIDMIRSRLVSLETDAQQIVDAGVAPVYQDVQAIGALLAQVTETVADTDHRVVTLEEQVRGLSKRGNRRRTAPGKAEKVDDTPSAAPEPAAAAAIEAAAEPVDEPVSAPAPTPPREDEEAAKKRAEALEAERSEALLKRVASAVENERLEVALQSVVTLPQRRARAYAILVNLKLDGAGTLDARHAVPAIEAAGASDAFDRAVVARALALAHKFASRESASIVFTPITGSAIMQSRFADWLVQTLTDNKDLAGRLVLEIAQKDVRAFSPIDYDLLGTLADLGFRMSVTQVTDARSDLFDLSRHGFRYAKAPVSLFLGTDAQTKSDIHPEDLADLAARNGMDLIVDQVESESQIVELLDCKLKYGQGNLFARPRVIEVEPHPLLGSSDSESANQAADIKTRAETDTAEEPSVLAPPQRSARALSRTA